MPPAELILPGIIVGSLFWGGLSHVLDVEWLRWRRVTHVLNCMGQWDPSIGWWDPSYTLAWRSRCSHIEYIDWCINHEASRRDYRDVFFRLERILKHPASCVYVHCKSGCDRSAITLYALLRLQFGLSANKSWASLQCRVGKNNWPVAKVWDKHDILVWIEEQLDK